jgi:predicted extracellular nuclease
VFNTGLIDLVNRIDAAKRYSYTFDGSAQAIDHMLVNEPTLKRVLKFGFARVDADFPEIWSNDPNRPERVSDHDAPVVFLSLDEPAPKVPPMTPVQ